MHRNPNPYCQIEPVEIIPKPPFDKPNVSPKFYVIK
jgi:hypothetical protein